ncbi:MAG: hypothetical protein LBP94_01100 [Zoogloeaceae bacterium]|jgi:hypothetical protein|nr:hypothetical protein [Zoogloeaceae bacterium]
MRRIVIGSIVLLAASNAGAEPLGRLFLTPERRAVLEHQRQPDVQEAPAFADPSVTVNGVVRRSSGHTTVWINQRPQHENAPDTGIATRVSPTHPARVTVAPDKEAPATLKVGESLQRGTREKTSALGDGRITVQPARQAPK